MAAPTLTSWVVIALLLCAAAGTARGDRDADLLDVNEGSNPDRKLLQLQPDGQGINVDDAGAMDDLHTGRALLGGGTFSNYDRSRSQGRDPYKKDEKDEKYKYQKDNKDKHFHGHGRFHGHDKKRFHGHDKNRFHGHKHREDSHHDHGHKHREDSHDNGGHKYREDSSYGGRKLLISDAVNNNGFA